MQLVATDAEFAKKTKIPQHVAREYLRADEKKKKADELEKAKKDKLKKLKK